MEVVNPLSSFRWDGALNINGVMLRGIPEKQGTSFSRHGYLAAKSYGADADYAGRMYRQGLRPLSGPTLAKARSMYGARIVPDFPPYWIIEPTNICNRACTFCAIGLADRPTLDGGTLRGNMKWAHFTKLMRECEQHDVFGLSLYQLGESALWKEGGLDISDMVTVAKSSGFKVVNVSTNGDVNLNPFLRCPLDDLIISIDGTTAEVYDANRPLPGGKDSKGVFDRTVAKVRAFLEKKAALEGPAPFVRLQIINKASTAPQILDFIRYWVQVPGVDDVFIKNLDGMNPWLGDAAVSAVEYGSKMAKVATMPCQHLWAVGSMVASGALNACCHDARTELTAPFPDGRRANIEECTFAEWWQGPFMEALRAEHASGVFRSPCGDCAERDVWVG